MLSFLLLPKLITSFIFADLCGSPKQFLLFLGGHDIGGGLLVGGAFTGDSSMMPGFLGLLMFMVLPKRATIIEMMTRIPRMVRILFLVVEELVEFLILRHSGSRAPFDAPPIDSG